MSAAEFTQLKEEVAGLHRKIDRASSAILDLTARVASMESGSSAEYTPTRTSGYVNWGPSHDVLKTQLWVQLNKIKEYIGQMESLWYFGTGQENLAKLPTSNDVHRVTEDTRFPQVGAYVNIYCPSVSSELAALQAQKLRPGSGLLERFDSNCKNDVHTFSSFEEYYKLNWV